MLHPPQNGIQDKCRYHKDRKAANCNLYFEHKHKYVQTHQFYEDKNIFVQYLLQTALADDLWPELSGSLRCQDIDERVTSQSEAEVRQTDQ